MIILDTHTLIWWIDNSPRLSKKAKKVIDGEAEKGTILISVITTWELSLLVKKGKLNLAKDINSFIKDLEETPFFQFIPIDNQIALKSVNLPDNFHGDPADRIIVATARETGAVLITSDEKIRKYSHVQTIW